jgi:glycosyltransferase involved in cell wall biosynthesis
MNRSVVHFTDTTGFGGAEKMLLAMLEGTDRHRWTPVLAHYPNDAAMTLGEAARRIGVRTHVLQEGAAGSGRAEVLALARWLRAERPAVFHAHLVWTLRCSAGLIAARLARVPAIVATQQLYGRPKGRRQRLRQWLVSLLPHRILPVSEAMAAELRAVVARPDRVVVVPNAIDVGRFRATDASGVAQHPFAGAGNPRVLTLARLDGQKGLGTLIEAAERLGGATVVIAGEGPDRAALEAEVRRRRLVDRVVFLGHREDVPALLASCDIFVLPSLFEGLPVSVLEAMAAARPVVATRIPGTDEAVVHGETGMLVPPNDPAALAAALRTLLDDQELRTRMGAAGQQRVTDRFSSVALARAVNGIYAEILGETPPGDTAHGVVAGPADSNG